MIDSTNTIDNMPMSDQPSPTETGANSQNSSGATANEPGMTWRERLQMKEAVLLGKMYGLGQMVGWESVRRGAKIEDAAKERWLRANHEAIYGEDSPSGSEDVGNDDMMVLGDVTITESKENPPSQPVKSSSSFLPKALTAAALIASGGGIAAGIPLAIDAIGALSQNATPAVAPADPPERPEPKTIHTKEREGIRVLEPTVHPPE